MDHDNLLIAFALTLFAGLSTGIGSLAALTTRRTNVTFLCIALSFSAGAMIYVSFVEIFGKARIALDAATGNHQQAYLYTTLAFFGGILVIALIDKLVPKYENPHEMHAIEEMDNQKEKADFRRLYHMGFVTALAIAIHNFPEGLATFTAALKDPSLGMSIAAALALHNIPEGIAVAVPIYFATGSRKTAFLLSFASGLSEPLGAVIGYLVLMPFFNDLVFGLLFASIGGVMVFISLDQILPAARAYGKHHTSIYALVAGMAVMAISLIFFIKPV